MARMEFEPREHDDGAAQGNTPDGLLQLGLMYSAGRGVEANLVTAHKWLNIAALKGCERAKQYRAELALEMTKREIAQAQRMAREWLTRH